jgi:hypothetical protein
VILPSFGRSKLRYYEELRTHTCENSHEAALPLAVSRRRLFMGEEVASDEWVSGEQSKKT